MSAVTPPPKTRSQGRRVSGSTDNRLRRSFGAPTLGDAQVSPRHVDADRFSAERIRDDVRRSRSREWVEDDAALRTSRENRNTAEIFRIRREVPAALLRVFRKD